MPEILSLRIEAEVELNAPIQMKLKKQNQDYMLSHEIHQKHAQGVDMSLEEH